MEQSDAREPVEKEVRFLVPIEKSDPPQRVTYGVVLEPDTEDLQGDVMTAEDIEQAAYDWMERSQHGGHMHADLVEGAKVVESYIAPCDIPVETAEGQQIIRKGSWVLAMRWPPEIWESIQKGELTGYSVGGSGVRLAIEKHGNHDQSTHGNWARRGYRGDPARDGAAAEGGGTPADQGAAAARREARGAGKGGAHKVGDVVRLKEDGATGTIVDYEPGKDGAPDEYAIAPEDLEPGGPRAIWVRADEIGAIEGPGVLDMGDKVTFRDGVEAKVVGVSRGHILVEGPGVPNGTMAVGHDDIDSDGNINLHAEYKPKYRGQYERPSAYGGGLAEQDDDALDGYPSGTVDDELLYPTGGKWAGEDDSSDAEREDAEWMAGYGTDASQGWEADAGYKTFARGQKVRTPTGKIRTVHSQRGAQVFVEEESNGWYHPSKLWPVKKSHEEEVLNSAVREGLRDAVAKHGSHDQSSHGNWARGGSRSSGNEEEVDLLDLFDESRGATVTLDGHAYTIKEIKPFKYVPGLDSVTLEPKDKNSAWYRAERAKLHDDWDLEVSDPERLGELAQQLPGWSRLEGVSKHGSHDQSSHGNWARGKTYHSEEIGEVTIPESDRSPVRPEDEERDEDLRLFRRTHSTRDGVAIEGQPKVQRIRNSEMFASADGRVRLNYAEWKWTGSGKQPKLHERGRWGVWPRGADRSNVYNVIWASNKTLAEFINSLDPGEYDLAT